VGGRQGIKVVPGAGKESGRDAVPAAFVAWKFCQWFSAPADEPSGREQELTVHTVTKILVVFAAILAVLLAALTMAYSVNATRITGDYRSAVERATQAETSAQNQIGSAQTANTELMRQNQILASKIAEIENHVRTLQAAEGDLKKQVRAAEAERDSIKAQLALLSASNQTLASLSQSYREEVTGLREKELLSNRQQIDLVDRINDLESQLEVANASTRSLQEQLAEANRTLQASGGIRVGDTATAGDPYRPSFAVSGKITSVGKDVTGKDSATINLGTNNRIKEKMILSVVRGDQFIGHLTVIRTDLQSSQGLIDYQGLKQPVQAGDEVRSFASR
jgi:hypothetical protein